MTVHQVAAEVGWKFSKTQRWLRDHPWMSHPRGFPPTYDARVIDLIREMQDKPRRPLSPEEDWLGVYLGETDAP